MSTTEYFLKFQSDREKKLIVSQGPPSSVSNAPHLSFFRLENLASSVFWEINNINKKNPACLICFS